MGNSIGAGISIAPLERRLDNVAQAAGRIELELSRYNERIEQVFGKLNALNAELSELKQDFERYMNDTRRTINLQKAATELIRVRQELEQNFGAYFAGNGPCPGQEDNDIPGYGRADACYAGILAGPLSGSCIGVDWQ